MSGGSPKRMTINHMTKSFGDVYSRLLDHHPSIQGEILYFVKEMEEKRKDREMDRMQKAEQYSRGINDHLEDSTNIQLQHYLPSIQQQVQESLGKIDKIFANQVEPSREKTLLESRQERVAKWAKFMDVMCEKSAAVDSEVSDELHRVTNYYKEMENKLKLLDNA